MSLADQTELLATAAMLRAGVYQPSEPYTKDAIQRAVGIVARRLIWETYWRATR